MASPVVKPREPKQPQPKNPLKEDPLEIMRRKFLAKCRFRALVRRVIDNLYWLQEDEEVYEGDNIKKRVEQAMRAKSKKKTLLDLKDKALLNKPAEERTEQEKKYIYRKIGGLKCFKRYPNHVKRKLAAATYFVYYAPGRVIVKQHQEAHALYFVVTGEVVVSITIFDELLQKHQSINVFVMNPGDMFGEVSLLHNIKRTATCTTSAHCEFLALMKSDFKIVLQDSLQKQWEEVKQAMSSFTYFDGLDEVSRREGCIVAKMKSFDPNDTILGDGAGVPNFVYFVLSGRCQMIESLKIITTEALGKKRYKLYDPYVKETDDDQLDFEKKYFADQKPKPETAKTTIEKEKSGLIKTLAEDKEDKSEAKTLVSEEGRPQDARKISGVSFKPRQESRSSKSPSCYQPMAHKQSMSTSVGSRSTRYEDGKRKSSGGDGPENLRTYFMQVCIFNPGSTFGFGENMRDRRIVAQTRVDCMLLPKMWLLQKNTANIWSRIQHYLQKKIPSKQKLFNEFVNQRRWLDWRDRIVMDIVDQSKTVNHTTIHDVPYSIRMQEQIDI